MKFLLSAFLIIGGFCGMGVSLLGDVVLSSNMLFVRGLELTFGLGFFSFVAFLSGLYLMFVGN